MIRSQRWSTSVILIALVVLTTAGQSRREARVELDKGLRLMAKGNFDGAIESFTRAIELGSRQEAQGLSGEGGKLKLTTADNAETSEAIVLIDPFTSVAYSNRAAARVRKGDLGGALADCDRAIAINPGLVDAYQNRGWIRWAMGNLEGAISDFDRLISMSPRHAKGYDLRGAVRIDQGELLKALKDLDQAVRLDPRDPKSFCDRGQVRHLFKDFRGALEDFDMAAKLNPQLACASYGQGLVRFDRAEWSEAIVYFTRAIERDHELALAYALRGLALRRLGRNAEAEKDIADSLRLDLRLKPLVGQPLVTTPPK
jgi:tetratricopeptide (TPR) repeat protein